jgi:hypothetical protein
MADGTDSVLSASSYCSAINNSLGGFCASFGGKLMVGSDCTAQRSLGCGFQATGQGSKLEVGHSCEATEGGCHGFAAEYGGEVSIGSGCQASNNCGAGFMADGTASVLSTSGCCSSTSNSLHGFYAAEGGQLKTGWGCRSVANAGHGYASRHERSNLMMGAGCTASKNSCSGFAALEGGALVAAQGCNAYDNSSFGVYVAPGSHLTMQGGFHALGNKAGQTNQPESFLRTAWRWLISFSSRDWDTLLVALFVCLSALFVVVIVWVLITQFYKAPAALKPLQAAKERWASVQH